MVDFEKVLLSVKENTEKMSASMADIKTTTDKIYKLEEKENKRSEETKKEAGVKKLRVAADDKEGKEGKDKTSQSVEKLVGIVSKLILSKATGAKGPAGAEVGNAALDAGKALLGAKFPGLSSFMATGGFVTTPPAQALATGGSAGFTVPGIMTGDKHPMMLPTGSFVLNRKASEYLQSGGVAGMSPVMLESQEMVFPPNMMTSFLTSLNKSVPRFANGGLVEHIHGDPTPGRSGTYDPTGHGGKNAHDHFAFESKQIRDTVEAELKKLNYKIGLKKQNST